MKVVRLFYCTAVSTALPYPGSPSITKDTSPLDGKTPFGFYCGKLI